MRALVEHRTLDDFRQGRISAKAIYRLVVLVGLVVQLLIAAELLYGGVPPSFIIIVLLLGVLGTVEWTQPRPSTPEKGKAGQTGASPGGPPSLSDQLSMSLGKVIFGKVIYTLGVSFGCGGATWDVVVLLGKWCFGGSILGFRPSEVPSEAVGLIVATIALAFVFGPRAWIRVRIARDRLSRKR
jgi:hypothetical protein